MSAQDLEQFREACNFMKAYGSRAHCVQADRLLSIINNAGKVAHQPAPVVDDARMARALEWVRTAARGNVGEGDALRVALVESARKHLPAIEEAIAAYDPNCGARTVRVVADAMRIDGSCYVIEAEDLASAQGVQS